MSAFNIKLHLILLHLKLPSPIETVEVILLEQSGFILKEFMTNEPCSCVCLASDFAVVGTDKFYRISLDHPNITGK